MKEFNLQNYATRIYILWINPSKLVISNQTLFGFFEDFEINSDIIPKEWIYGSIKYNEFLKIICILYDTETINEVFIIKVYKDLCFKYDYSGFDGNKTVYHVKRNVNKVIENNKSFIEELMVQINLQLIDTKNRKSSVVTFNFYKLIKILEILFIFPELIDLKNSLLLFIKSLEKDVFFVDDKNYKHEIIKFNEDEAGFFTIDGLVNFLLVISRYIFYKYGKVYKKLQNENSNLNYLIWYIYYSIERNIVI